MRVDHLLRPHAPGMVRRTASGIPDLVGSTHPADHAHRAAQLLANRQLGAGHRTARSVAAGARLAWPAGWPDNEREIDQFSLEDAEAGPALMRVSAAPIFQ
jgi:hypothetical protein